MAKRATPSSKPFDIDIPPGMVLREGPIAAEGRWIGGDHVRFVRGRAEKIGGWQSYTGAADPDVLGIARGAHSWSDLSARSWAALGTERRLYAIDSNRLVSNITPFAGQASLNNALTAVNGEKTVTLEYPAHDAIVGQRLIIGGAGMIGGIPFAGEYDITSVVDTDNITFDLPTPAVADEANGGGSILVVIEIAPGPQDPVFGLGWGAGTWGSGTWGTPRSTSSIVLDNRAWTMGNMGKLLMACASNGPIYQWDPTAIPIQRASLITGTDIPGAARGIFVTDERFLIAYGSSPDTGVDIDTMLIRWCDQGDPFYWQASVGHTAGARRLQRGKKLIAGTYLANRVSLIWSDSALYMLQYTGSNFIFDSRVVGEECGLVGPHSWARVEARAFWLGPSDFWMFSGGGVAPIPNSDDIAEWVFNQLRKLYASKTYAFYNPKFREVWFLFCTEADDEPAYYATVRIDEWHWTKGTLSRTGGFRTSGDGAPPVLADPDGRLWEHEIGLNAGDAALDSYIQSGPIRIEKGARDMDVFAFYPDMQRHEQALELSIHSRDNSNEPYTDIDTRSVDPGFGAFDLRMSGRFLSFELRSNLVDGDFRLGVNQFEARPAGRRRRA